MMFSVFWPVVFVLGLIVGSFLNVVAYRYGTGQGIARGRSKCFSCRKTLAWYELVPILSFIFLRAKCGSCKSKISWQYPLVELITGLVFTGIAWAYLSVTIGAAFWSGLALLWIAASLLIAIAVYDWHHMIIPDGLVYVLIGVAFISAFMPQGETFLNSQGLPLGALTTSLGLFLFFASLWYFSGGRWMGFGDAKLAVAIGLLLGWPLGVSAVIIAFWLGAAIGVGLLLIPPLVHSLNSRRGRQLVTMKTEIPFAPFLVLATLLVLIFNFNVIPVL